MNNKNSNKIDWGSICGTVFFGVIIVGFICGIIHDENLKKQYGETRYEFVITDKYDDLGSNWHVVGGRATEQEYHIVYKYRLTNRPDDERNMQWYIGQRTVDGGRYRELHVGQTLYNDSQIFPY